MLITIDRVECLVKKSLKKKFSSTFGKMCAYFVKYEFSMLIRRIKISKRILVIPSFTITLIDYEKNGSFVKLF